MKTKKRIDKNLRNILSKTLRNRKKGGAVLGEGAHGKAYNLSSLEDSDSKTIYNKIKKHLSSIKSIELHTKNENNEAIIKVFSSRMLYQIQTLNIFQIHRLCISNGT